MILKAILEKVIETILLAAAKWAIGIVAPFLVPIFFIFSALDALGAVLKFLDKTLKALTTGESEILNLTFSYPLLGDNKPELKFASDLLKSDDDANATPSLAFEISVVCSFDKAKGTQAFIEKWAKDNGLNPDEVKDDLKFFKDLIAKILKVVTFLTDVKKVVGVAAKAITNYVFEPVKEALSNLM